MICCLLNMNTPEIINKMYNEVNELEREAIRVNLDIEYINMWKRISLVQIKTCKRLLNNKSEFYKEFSNFNLCMSVMSRKLLI